MQWCDKYLLTINNIHWERIFLEFSIKVSPAKDTIPAPCPEELSFAFMEITEAAPNVCPGAQVCSPQELCKKLIPISFDSRHNDAADGSSSFTFSINMTAVSRRSFLDNGDWRICAVAGNDLFPVGIDCSLAYEADQWSRIFKYGKNQYAYNVSFSVREISRTQIELILSSYFMRINRQWKKRKYVQEALTVKGKFRRFYLWLVILLIRSFYFCFSRLLPKRGTRVLFMTETKDYLWGNLKFIYDRILERELSKRFRLRCSCRKSVGVRKSAVSWIKTIFYIAQSDYIFIDDYAPLFGFFKLYKKTQLIQVWHAGEGFKSVGYSRFGKEGSPFPSGSCHKAYTWALTGAPSLVKVYEEVFGIEKEAFLPLGMARLDHFLDQEHILDFKNRFFEKWPALKNKQIILFAPTFRGAGQKEAWYDYSRLDLKRIYDFCGNDTLFVVKMHPFIQTPMPIPKAYKDRIYDFSSYPDINELFYITDILVTDYSSNYYEFALLKKPIVFYTYDREFYELTRGVHRSVLLHAPGRVCDSFDDLMSALTNKDYQLEKTCQFVNENFAAYDGHASDRIINKILLNEGETNE
ncbi:MAG: CDP-glycerol glycerophosphotransferase family protein [Clostridiales bacterium]|nr:CDP-glycerol glycerophosphotransferase family protein [Clostridiales bacterium]